MMVALFVTILSGLQIKAQTDANQLLSLVYNKLQKANDYSVQAHIKVDIPLIRILPVDVKIYFKQKDKFKVESKSIAIVPRQGFNQVSEMLANSNANTAMIQGNEKIGAIETRIVNIIPLSDTSDMILGKLWIDPKQNLIIKSQLTTRSNGTIQTEFTYGSQLAFGLPDEMIFSVDVKKFKVPKGVANEPGKNETRSKNTLKENKKGKIYITLKNYVINKGIPDNIFKK